MSSKKPEAIVFFAPIVDPANLLYNKKNKLKITRKIF